jgi:hypothetical protein
VDNRNSETTAEKREWVRPELQRLEAGSAESNFSGIPDNSSPQAS